MLPLQKRKNLFLNHQHNKNFHCVHAVTDGLEFYKTLFYMNEFSFSQLWFPNSLH